MGHSYIILFIFSFIVTGCSKNLVIRDTISEPKSEIELAKYVHVEEYDLKKNYFNSHNKSIEKNLSGITWWPKPKSVTTDNGLLLVVGNRPPVIYLLNLEGDVLDVKSLKDPSTKCSENINENYCFNDTEGITHIKGNEFAIIEEKRKKITKISISLKHKSGENITFDKIVVVSSDEVNVDYESGSNESFEGIMYVPNGKKFYVVNEQKPKKLLKISYQELSNSEIKHISKTCGGAMSMVDWAGLSTIPESTNNHFLLISSDLKSKYISELDKECKLVQWLGLSQFSPDKVCKKKNEIMRCIPNPEGLVVVKTKDKCKDGKCIVGEHIIYVLSEPYFLYKFTK